MPSASTISADASSIATESSLLLRARPVSVAQKNSKLMVGGWGRGRRRSPRSKRGIVPWIGARKLHGRGESIGIGGFGSGLRCGRRTRLRPEFRLDGPQVLGQLAAIGIAHFRTLLERQRHDVGERL